MSGNKFFFEEDPESSTESGVGFAEQADIFGEIVEQAGVADSKMLQSMEPMKAEPAVMEIKQLNNNALLIEYGVVDQDYVLHLTPVHHERNLKHNNKLRAAIETTVKEMNKVVPFDLTVQIHLPQEDWEVKVLSFVIKGGANAWNFDRTEFEAKVVPTVFQRVTDICVKL